MDLTVMRIVIEGAKDLRALRHNYNLLDYYNTDTETSSMAHTTGYTCPAMVKLIALGLWTEPGVAPPEVIGQNAECFDSVIKHLEDRNVQIFQRVDEL
jgi:lysine 6-dehydrogenase